MAHFFRAPDRRQRFLLPVDMMDWLPEDDIVHLVVDAVGLMDLSGFAATCKVGHAGQPNRGVRAVHRHSEGPQAAGRAARGASPAGADAAVHDSS